jgi:hypothetical protein
VNRMYVYIVPSSSAFFLTNLCFFTHVRYGEACPNGKQFKPARKVIGSCSFYMGHGSDYLMKR